MIFIWLNNSDLAVSRVTKRVAAGGHNIPEDVIRRRYHRGLDNFFQLYSTLADSIFQEAVDEAIEQHRSLGHAIAVSDDDGNVIEIQPTA